MKYLLLVVFAAVAVTLVSSQTNATTAATGMTTVIVTETGTMTTMAATTTGAPDDTKWMVKYSNGSACILAELAADMSVEYETSNSTKKATLKLPEDATVDVDASSCGDETSPAVLVLTWGMNNITHEFELKDKKYSLTKVEAGLYHDAAHFPDSKNNGTAVLYTGTPPADLFMASSDMSYRCNSPDTVILMEKKWNVTYSDVKVQPFGVQDDKFSNESVCAADDATTTAAPTTTMTTPMITTSMPPPSEWDVRDSNNTVCMNMTFSCKLSIKYITEAMKENTTEVNVPQEADPSQSTCGDMDATFVLTFFDGWNLTMKFKRDTKDSSKSYKVTNFTLAYVFDDHFINPYEHDKSVMVYNEKTGIEADNSKYYKCDATVKVKANNSTTYFSEMEIQPFAKDTDGTRGDSYTQCAADSEISNIVPIAVGCALAALVIIVLIAYLIGRSRSTRQGYQSV